MIGNERKKHHNKAIYATIEQNKHKLIEMQELENRV